MSESLEHRGRDIECAAEIVPEELPEHPGLVPHILVRYTVRRGDEAPFTVEYRIPYAAAAGPPVLQNPQTETPETAAIRKGMAAVRYLIDEGETQPGELVEVVWYK